MIFFIKIWSSDWIGFIKLLFLIPIPRMFLNDIFSKKEKIVDVFTLAFILIYLEMLLYYFLLLENAG